MNLNRVTIAGNLTRDPELRYTPSGKAIAKFGLAINRKWTNDAGEKKEEVTYVDVDAFGRTAENCGQYFKKVRPVFIEGRLKLDQWDDKQTWQKRSKLGIVAESVQFLGSPTGEPAARPTTTAAAAPTTPTEPTESDDVPF